MEQQPYIIERTFSVSSEKIWKAITDKDQMKQWYFDLAEFKPEVGFEFQFFAGTEDKKWLHVCKVTEAITNKKLTYSWRYDGHYGISYVTFELFPAGERTRLKLTHAGLESFPSEAVPEFKKENFVEGWTQLIGTSLKSFVEK